MYNFYQDFYKTAADSPVFSRYCKEVFGVDFSQDGFSDIGEINGLIKAANIHAQSTVLDIGCGNGKMCEYIHRQTGATVYGFDYSDTAIRRARERTAGYDRLRFDVGVIGETEYPTAMFDAVLSVDTIFFADDMGAFVKQIHGWLKPGGVLAVMYGCFDQIEPRIGRDNNAFAAALREYPYEATDCTHNHYQFVKRKRRAAEKMADDFRQAGLERICDRLIIESIYDPDMTFDEFIQHYSRYMYIVKKGNGDNQ